MAESSGLMGFSALPLHSWNRPGYVTLDGDRILYGRTTDWTEAVARDDSRMDGALDAFVRLKTGEDIVRFGQRWGVLEICEHRVPYIHNSPWSRVGGFEPCLPVGWPTQRWEPVERWFYFSGIARAALNVAASLHADSAPSEEDTLRLWNMPEEISGGRSKLAGAPHAWGALDVVIGQLM